MPLKLQINRSSFAGEADENLRRNLHALIEGYSADKE